MNILNSKFIIPKRKEISSRKRLTRLFEENIDKKLFVVTAGAGFGKTTLVVDALNQMNLDCAWYRLDEQDTDFQVFLTHLYSLVLRQFQNGREVNSEELFSSGISGKNDLLIKWLTFLQEQVHRQFVIIFDDYHLVQENEVINSAVDFILQRLPDWVSLVIIGRKKLPLSLSWMRVQESLIEIDEAELCFSKQEIEQFFKHHVRIEQTDVDFIQNATKGWAASIVLLKHAVTQQPYASLSERLSKFAQKPNSVFSYLEENVFNQQPDHIQKFMMKMALLPEINALKCSEIFEIEDARRILSHMVRDHLMIFPVDQSETVFTLHHLFRDFLIEKLHKHFPVDEINQLHCRIASSFKTSDIDLALHHFVAGQNYDQAIKIIEENEMDFLLRGKAEFLDRILRQIPQEIVYENPQILLSLSRICSHYGDPEKAIALTSKALKKLQHQKEKDKIIACVIELGMQYYYTGHLKEAKLMMEQVLDSIDKESQTYVLAMTFLTFLPSILGEFETSRKHEREARKIISDYSEFEKTIATLLLDISLTHTLFFMGEFQYSHQLSLKLLDAVLQMNIETCLPLVYYQLSANSFFLGEWENGCRYAEKGVDICEKMSLSDSRKAWNHLAWAQNHLGCRQLGKAQEQLNISIHLFERPGNRWGLASAQECQAEIYLKENQTRPAKRVLENALDLIRGYGLKVTRGILENTYAQILQAENQNQKSFTYLKSARPDLAGASYHLFNNHLLSARGFLNLEQTESSISYLSQALDLSKKFSFERYMIENKEWIIPLYVQAKTENNPLPSEVQTYAENLFHNEILSASQKLTLSLLGKFKLDIGFRKLDASAWKSSKALMLLKYLAANQEQGYFPKDFLIELLWPEQDPEKTGSRFHMAMSSLRKTLEPDLPPKASSAYIDRKKDTYRISTDLCTVDTDLFLSLIVKARKASPGSTEALNFYLEACELYKGPFLEEDLYEDWCIEKRHIFLQQYVDALQAVIQISDTQNNIEQAIVYSQKLLDASPLDETAALRLMNHFSQTGATSKAISIYKTFISQADELAIPVSKKIILLFKNLVKI